MQELSTQIIANYTDILKDKDAGGEKPMPKAGKKSISDLKPDTSAIIEVVASGSIAWHGLQEREKCSHSCLLEHPDVAEKPHI